MTADQFHEWLDAYGKAWETRDPQAAVALFTSDVEYYETPFDAPFSGQEAVRSYWTGATGAQRNIRFDHQPVAMTEHVGVARWHATFQRIPSGKEVELDGVLVVTFTPDNLCRILREWWHSAASSE